MCLGSDSERNGERKSTIRGSVLYLLILREKERASEREREKIFPPMSFVKSERTLQLIGNGRTMNKERKCLTFKTNEKSVCKRASPADVFLFSWEHLRVLCRYRWRNDDRNNSRALQAESASPCFADVFALGQARAAARRREYLHCRSSILNVTATLDKRTCAEENEVGLNIIT